MRNSKEVKEVCGRGGPDRLGRDAAQSRDFFANVAHPGGLVALAAIRSGREVRTVRLDQQAVERQNEALEDLEEYYGPSYANGLYGAPGR